MRASSWTDMAAVVCALVCFAFTYVSAGTCDAPIQLSTAASILSVMTGINKKMLTVESAIKNVESKIVTLQSSAVNCSTRLLKVEAKMIHGTDSSTQTKPGESFLAEMCDEITVLGAGKSRTSAYGDVNGVYFRSTSGLPNGGSAKFPYYCRNNNCGDSVFNQWGSTAYGWGIQLKLHHHYQNHKVSHTVTPFTAIRGGSYGQAPIPTFYCSKINSMYNKGKSTKPGDSFYAVQCDEITVKGGGASKTASYGDVNGIYRVANKITSLPNGGSNNYPYYCRVSSNAVNCRDSVFNQWGSTAYGWGIQLKLHHHYQNHLVEDIVKPFTAIRGGSYGQLPIPSFFCSKMNTNTRPGEAFLASECDEITVYGAANSRAGLGTVNGIYAKSTSGLPNGGSTKYPYYCIGNGQNCRGSVLNQWGSTGYGWGIQLKLHHQFQNHQVSGTIRPFTSIRGGHGSNPIPKFYCSKFTGKV